LAHRRTFDLLLVLTRVYPDAAFGVGTGDIVIDELQCSGSEDDVQFCASSPWLTHDCAHWQDVGIDCGR